MANSPITVRPMSAHTLRWWTNRFSSIDKNPTYQRRGKIWSNVDKGYLIGSILNGFDVPKIYMADFTFRDSALNHAQLPYAIIDGKQRLEAIEDFVAGRIVLNENFVYLENEELNLRGLGYKDLKATYPAIAEKFDEYELSVMSVVTDDEGKVNDLFIRLNRSKPLTGAEVRNAMEGPVPQLIRIVSGNEFFSSNIKFKVLRGDDLNLAAKVVAFEYFEQLQSTKKSDLDGFVKSDNLDKERLERATLQALDIFTDMSGIFLPDDALLSSSGVIPVYYWFIRSLSSETYPFVRQFLKEFEDQRARNSETILLVATAGVRAESMWIMSHGHIIVRSGASKRSSSRSAKSLVTHGSAPLCCALWAKKQSASEPNHAASSAPTNYSPQSAPANLAAFHPAWATAPASVTHRQAMRDVLSGAARSPEVTPS